MRRTWLPLPIGGIAALLLALGVFATGAAAGPATATFSDAAGDAGGAPDITSVAISDAAATGIVTIQVTATGVQPYSSVNVWLNTDKNPSTGSPSGSEYLVYYWVEPNDWGWDVGRWDGTKWQEVPQSGAMAFGRSGNTLTWQLAKADIGDPTGFSFWVNGVLTDSSGDNVVAHDEAPDDGYWSYDLAAKAPPATTTTGTKPAVVRPVIAAPTTAPARVVAGKRLTVSFPVTRSDTGAALASGTMICDPSVAGKVLPHAELFAGGVARLSFTVPASAKGKQLKVKVTIRAGGQSATRVATFKVG